MGSRSRLAVILFILSEANFFALLIIAYLYFHAHGGAGPNAANSLNVARTGGFSILLFASSATVWLAGRSVRSGAVRAALGWLLVTIALGLIFLFGQGLEYAGLFAKGVFVSRNLFATAFFTVTGFHGLHVFGGLCALSILAAIVATRGFSSDERMRDSIETVSLYWHFVDGVWAIVFSVVYLMA